MSADIAEQTPVGELYVTALIRAQYRLSLVVLGVGVATIVGLPLLFWLVPASRAATVGGLPLPWLALWVALYPACFGLGWWYVRASRAVEESFARAVSEG